MIYFKIQQKQTIYVKFLITVNNLLFNKNLLTSFNSKLIIKKIIINHLYQNKIMKHQNNSKKNQIK